MKVFDCKQGSTEWTILRSGVVTASEVDALVSPTFKIRTGEGPETYLYRKLCERALGWVPPDVATFSMDQGMFMETVAVPWYEFTYDVQVTRVGFCLSDCGRYGCSPDGLIGEDSGLEIKAPQVPQHLRYLFKNELPADYRTQVHFSMLVTNRPTWKFLSFSRHIKSLVVTVERDDKIDATLKQALSEFFERFDECAAKLTQIADGLAPVLSPEQKR